MTPHVAILGAGTGGTLTANRLRRTYKPSELAITVVDQDDRHVYQPGLLCVPDNAPESVRLAGAPKEVEVFADVACPFTHVGLRRFQAYREQRGRSEPVLRVRAWPLELVNGTALDGPSLRPKIDALRAAVAPDLFVGFDEDRFPSTTLPAMAAEVAAYRQGPEVGERFSLAVRHALFEEGLDVSDPEVLRRICRSLGTPEPTETDRSGMRRDFAVGRLRGVSGSPHFFTADGDFFCPSLDITHGDAGYQVSFDRDGFERFVTSVFD